jgi:hypothetical protein
MDRRARGRVRGVAVSLSVALSLALVPAAEAAQQIISSSGPLTNIWLNDNLGCQADHSGDSSHEFFGGTDPGSCGTFLSAGGTSYGSRFTQFTPVSQSGVTGSGTSGNPFKVVTVVDVGTTGLRITQTDTYVTGQEFYRTDITVSSSAGTPIDAALYHAADCFLQNSDTGFGLFDSSTGGIFCTANPNNSPPARVEGFTPLSAGSHYVEDVYSTVYGDITAAGSQFPDTCRCTERIDNGAGLSWAITVPAGGAVTRSLQTTFSPSGQIQPVPPPVLGKAVNVGLVSGRVTIGVPRTARSASGAQTSAVRFVPLRGTRQIPVGSFLNTSRGKVRLTSAANTSGAIQSGDFNGGVFQVLQSRRLRGLTDLNLSGGSFRACTARAGKRASASRSRRVVRRLSGSGSGRYRTRGRYSAATVRGTIWDTVDRCDGTLTRVKRGVVVVRDFRARRNITVRAGKSYLAPAP